MIRRAPAVLLLLAPLWLAAQDVRAQDRAPVVHALLFYSPTCPHCELVINTLLPPLQQRYGQSLDVVGINVATQGGLRLYQSAVSWYMIHEDRQGVPTMIIGSHVLVGEVEIPTMLPQIADSALAHGGIDWPEAPELRQALMASGLIQPTTPDSARADSAARAAAPPDSTRRDTVPRTDTAVATPQPRADTATPAPTPPSGRGAAAVPADTAAPAVAQPDTAGAAPAPMEPDTLPATPGGLRELDADGVPLTMADRFRLDPLANSTAVGVLIFMTATLVLVGFGVGSPKLRPPLPPDWLVPVFALAGMGVAAYLAFVEITGTEAICGPVGDCNTVQQSQYARLFGVVPVGLLGLIGFAVLLLVWLLALRTGGRTRRVARILAWAMAVVATLFSIYLTFLEPFVIGATCAWCLTSAVIATLLLLSTTPAAAEELRAARRANTR